MSEDLNIEHSSMVTALAKSGEDIMNDLLPMKAHILHMAIGISGEVAELQEALDSFPIDVGNVVEELGDAEFYLEGARQGYGVTRDYTIADNVAGHPPKPDRDYRRHMLNRLVIHAGDFLDNAKRYTIYNKDLDMQRTIFLFNQIEFHLEGFRKSFDIPREETLVHNLNKLLKGDKARYKQGTYTNEQAINRQDKEDG